MCRSTFALGMIASILLCACGAKQSASSDDLQKQLEKATLNGGVLSAAKPDVKIYVDQAANALKNDDQVGAVMSLRSVRDSGNLTAEQALSVSDMMANARAILVERAARGDQKAAQALQILTMNPPR